LFDKVRVSFDRCLSKTDLSKTDFTFLKLGAVFADFQLDLAAELGPWSPQNSADQSTEGSRVKFSFVVGKRNFDMRGLKTLTNTVGLCRMRSVNFEVVQWLSRMLSHETCRQLSRIAHLRQFVSQVFRFYRVDGGSHAEQLCLPSCPFH
jgi:hypothetical protein